MRLFRDLDQVLLGALHATLVAAVARDARAADDAVPVLPQLPGEPIYGLAAPGAECEMDVAAPCGDPSCRAGA